MITFKDFLLESAVSKQPEYTGLEVKDAVKLLNAKCKNALWMLNENKPFYRGFRQADLKFKLDKTGFAKVDTSATERQSQNTTNYYTVLLDNNPNMKDYPKRSRSFVGSTDGAMARSYSNGSLDGVAAIMIPTDTAGIGIVNKSDIWGTNITLFGSKDDIRSFNNDFADMGIAAKMESFKLFDRLTAANDSATLAKFKKVFQKPVDFSEKGFLDQVFEAYSPENTGFTTATTATFQSQLKMSKSEVWVGGEVVLISPALWKKMRESI